MQTEKIGRLEAKQDQPEDEQENGQREEAADLEINDLEATLEATQYVANRDIKEWIAEYPSVDYEPDIPVDGTNIIGPKDRPESIIKNSDIYIDEQ